MSKEKHRKQSSNVCIKLQEHKLDAQQFIYILNNNSSVITVMLRCEEEGGNMFCWDYVTDNMHLHILFPSLPLWSLERSSFLRFGFGDHFNGCGHRCGSLQILGGAGVCSLVHVPHLVHQEDRLGLLLSGSSNHWTDAFLCVQRSPYLQPA